MNLNINAQQLKSHQQKAKSRRLHGCAEYHPCLTFLLLFVSRQKVNKKNK